MLELRYGVISREKRQRLQAGKGVKKNGMYIHDRAASFESLPPGPDPKSVSKDIHTYLPKLTKRGTLFRATQATVDQRQNEFSALVGILSGGCTIAHQRAPGGSNHSRFFWLLATRSRPRSKERSAATEG